MNDAPYNTASQNGQPPAGNAPVFILTTSRSGSTLLRFILDSHPDLACPPETLIGSTGAAMVRLWASLEHSGDAERPDSGRPSDVSPEGLGVIRAALDSAYGSYLSRRGKKRWCDKSLDSFQFGETIRLIYPQAKFICLVRHCMDVIASGVRNCPWGVSRYGFDSFVAKYPGNSVAAIGSYWLSCTRTMLDFYDQHQESCVLVRYEDLVTAPEQTVAEVLRFIGAAPAPGITDACFALPHEERGPGDEKIWFTSRVSADSMGQGISVPPMALPPDARTSINDLLQRLRYKTIDGNWSSAVGILDPRADAPAATASGHSPADNGRSRAELDGVVQTLRDRLAESSGMRARVLAQWPSVAGSAVRLIAESPAGEFAEITWQFASADGAAPDGALANGGDTTTHQAAPAAGAGAASMMVASPATWTSLLGRQVNLVEAIADGRLRCFNPKDQHRVRSDEIHATAALLGFATVPVDHTAPPEHPAPTANTVVIGAKG
jgi:hypothetical protein